MAWGLIGQSLLQGCNGRSRDVLLNEAGGGEDEFEMDLIWSAIAKSVHPATIPAEKKKRRKN